MHHDDVPYTLPVDFRGENAVIVYMGFPGDAWTFWFADGRPWPDDLKPEEVGAIGQAVERDACERMRGG